MAGVTRFNPHSIEGHYSLEMASYLVHRAQPRSVRICTEDIEVAKAAVRRLAWVADGIAVEHEEIAEAISKTLGPRLRVANGAEPDVALVPFSRQQYAEAPRARRLILIGHNALSYKSLLYPGQIADNVLGQVRWLRRGYQLQDRVGLFGPGFLIRWILSTAAGPRWAHAHFQLGQRAMDRLFTTAHWWLGYITVLAGTRRIT